MTGTPPTDQQLDLDAIEARLDAATEGPWQRSEDYSDVLTPEGDCIASFWKSADGDLIAHAPADITRLVAEVRRLRAELAPYEMLAPQQCPAGKHADWLVDSEYAHACPWCRIAELEGPAVEARAALAALCYDLEDPGTAALGALFLLSRATSGVEAPKDDAESALAQHDAQVLRRAAETLEATDRDDDAVNLLYLLADQTTAPAGA